MNTETTWVIIAALGVAGFGVAWMIVRADIRYERSELPIVARPRRFVPAVPRPHIRQPAVWLHDAPPRAFTAEQAHTAMQHHVDCLLSECPRKRAAHHALVAAGHISPPPRQALIR